MFKENDEEKTNELEIISANQYNNSSQITTSTSSNGLNSTEEQSVGQISLNKATLLMTK